MNDVLEQRLAAKKRDFCVKITPLNTTTATKEHGLEDN